MPFDVSLVRTSVLGALLAVAISMLTTACCGDSDPLEVRMDRERIDGIYHLSDVGEMPISLPADEAHIARTVDAQDVTLSIEGPTAALSFSVEGKHYTYTFNIHEEPFESHVFP